MFSLHTEDVHEVAIAMAHRHLNHRQYRGYYRRLYSHGFNMLPRDKSFSQSLSPLGLRGTFLKSNRVKCVFRSSCACASLNRQDSERWKPTLALSLNPNDETNDTNSSTFPKRLVTSAILNSPLRRVQSWLVIITIAITHPGRSIRHASRMQPGQLTPMRLKAQTTTSTT